MDWLFYLGILGICAFIGGAAVSYGRIGAASALALGAPMMFGWAKVLTMLPLA